MNTFVTDNTVWFITNDAYLRVPRRGSDVNPLGPYRTEDSLDKDRWVRYDGLAEVKEYDGLHLYIFRREGEFQRDPRIISGVGEWAHLEREYVGRWPKFDLTGTTAVDLQQLLKELMERLSR